MANETNQIKLANLGRRMIEQKIFERRHAARNRRILRVVYSHINASATELQERLREIVNEDYQSMDEQEVQAEITKLR